ENALIDVQMLLKENPQNAYLLGGVEEISNYNYNIEYLGGWYKKEDLSNADLYEKPSPGSIAGEGAAMFEVNNISENAIARLKGIEVIHSSDIKVIKTRIQQFLSAHLPEKIDLLLSGENGDERFNPFYLAVEE